VSAFHGALDESLNIAYSRESIMNEGKSIDSVLGVLWQHECYNWCGV
jgi:hypothetical protein